MQLLVKVAAEPVGLIHLIRKVQIAALQKFFPGRRRTDRLQQPDHLLVSQRFVPHRHDLAVTPDFGRLSLQQMQVTAPPLHQHAKKFVNRIVHPSCPAKAAAKAFLFSALR